MVDLVSLAVALIAVAVSAFIYLETREQRKLMQVMVESLAFLQKPSKPRRASKPRKLSARLVSTRSATNERVSPAPPTLVLRPQLDPKPISPAEQARIALGLRREERKRLELQLRQQREQWKRQKDVTKAIGWVLDRMDSDEDDEEED